MPSDIIVAMDWGLIIISTWAILWLVLMLRVNIVFRHRSRAVDLIYAHQMSCLFTKSMRGREAEKLLDYDCKGDSWWQIFDLRKWTFNQFFPHIVAATVEANLRGYEPWDQKAWDKHVGVT